MKYIVAVIIILFSQKLFAENTDEPVSAVQFIAAEGAFALLSAIGAKHHDSYARWFIISNPWAMAEAFHDENDTLFYTSIITSEALALYVINLDENKYNETERFQKNMIAWHVVAGVIGATYWLSSDNEKENVPLSFVPFHDGGIFNIKFSFY